VLGLLRDQVPPGDITAIAPPGLDLPVDQIVAVRAKGPHGFALSWKAIAAARRDHDLAWLVVGDPKSQSYRRAALLLALARAREKSVVGPEGEITPFDEWRASVGVSLGPISLLRAGLRRLSNPFAAARAGRLLRGGKPPWGFKRVNIGVSDRCNHRCIMCSEHSPYCAEGTRRMAADGVLAERDFGVMDQETYAALIADLSEMGCEGVELCGLGEPLLHPKLFDFLRQAKEAGLWVRLVTNASLLDEERARELVALGLNELHVSVNAGTAETYAKVHGVAESGFGRVLDAIRAVLRARDQAGSSTPVVETSFVVQADNYTEPVTWVQAVSEAGADIATFSALGAAPLEAPVQLTDEQLEAAKRYVAEAVELAQSKGLEVRGTFGALAESGTAFSMDIYADMPCYIGHIFALVTADGRIHPCCACERVVGDVKEGGFAAAWRAETYRQFREECLDLPNRLLALEGCSCMSCPYGPWNAEFHARLYHL
jgi:MoaA/NifB/PqqE/SkfB family radical SAM enzyme